MGKTRDTAKWLKDKTLTRDKIVDDFLEGSDLNLTNGNEDATLTGLKPGDQPSSAVVLSQLADATLWLSARGEIASGGTTIIIARPLMGLLSMLVSGNVHNPTEGKSKHVSATVVNEDGEISDSINTKIGKAKIDFTVDKNGADVRVLIKNNESFKLGYNFIYATFGTVI